MLSLKNIEKILASGKPVVWTMHDMWPVSYTHLDVYKRQTWLSISLLLAAYGYLPVQAKRLSFFIGRNTLVILLFSPMFTILSKAFLPVFAFDPTGMLFLVTATAFTLSGCMGMAWAMDKMHVSRFFFGKRTILC